MKTDPENTDYTMEHGASRNYEPWREKAKATNAALADRSAADLLTSLRCIMHKHVFIKEVKPR